MRRFLAYVSAPPDSTAVTALATIDVTIYPSECDAFGRLNAAAFLTVLERARWESLARGPGLDLFRRNGVWPAVRRATMDYRAGIYPGDVLRIETAVAQRGTTSVTLRHVATRVSDRAIVAEAELVFVMVDRVGRPTPMSEELARVFGPRTAGAGGLAAGREAIRVTVDGGRVELAVEARGDGIPVLFVHGFPLDRTLWRHQLAGLSRYRRIAPDLRGAGASGAPAPPDGYSMTRYADDLVGVLDELGVGQAVVCGLSLGGYILFELLRRHPDRVRAVIFADTRAEADSAEGRRGRDELAEAVARDGTEVLVERMLPKLLAPATHAAQPEVVAHVREMIRRAPVPGILGALRAMRERPDSTAVLGTIRVPTLVLVGADDELTPPAGARAMAELVPGARYAEIPAGGHLAPLEQPLATGRVLAEFIESLP